MTTSIPSRLIYAAIQELSDYSDLDFQPEIVMEYGSENCLGFIGDQGMAYVFISLLIQHAESDVNKEMAVDIRKTVVSSSESTPYISNPSASLFYWPGIQADCSDQSYESLTLTLGIGFADPAELRKPVQEFLEGTSTVRWELNGLDRGFPSIRFVGSPEDLRLLKNKYES